MGTSCEHKRFPPRPRLVDLLGLGGAYLPMLISDPSAEVDADLQLALKLSESHTRRSSEGHGPSLLQRQHWLQ